MCVDTASEEKNVFRKRQDLPEEAFFVPTEADLDKVRRRLAQAKCLLRRPLLSVAYRGYFCGWSSRRASH